MSDFTQAEINSLSAQFEQKTPQEILSWAVETFTPHVAMSSSFQTQSVPLLHMVSQIAPDLRVFFVDTGYHFWDTLIFREKLERIWGLRVVDLHLDETWEMFMRRFGKDLYMNDPDLCCYVRKVQPMQIAVEGLRAWITGIRRDQTAHRTKAQILELQKDGIIKINPMLNWTKREVWQYIREQDLPEHPLVDQGYISIGCRPCTRPVMPGGEDRSGRWIGTAKTECGLHTEMFEQKNRDLDEVMESFHFSMQDLPKNRKD